MTAHTTTHQKVSSDVQTRVFWKNPNHFADLFNATIFQGAQILKPDSLEEMDSNVAGVIEGRGGRISLGRIRDLVRKSAYGTEFVILGIENQMRIHYAMPLRAMLYDALGYLHETEEIARNRKASKVKMMQDEFLSNYMKQDKITPIVTIVLYYGEKPWDGPRSMIEMMGELPEELKGVISDYKMNLVEVLREDSSKYHDEEIRQVIEYSQAFMAGNLDKVNELNRIEIVTKDVAYMISAITKATQIATKVKEGKEEEVNMCKLIDDLIAEGERRGIEQGRMEVINTLMESMNLTRSEVLDALKIPESERERYSMQIS